MKFVLNHNSKHHAYLKHNEIKVFYNRLCKLELFSAYALRMVILTVTRTSEVLKSKFEEFDLENRIFHGSLMKTHKFT